MEIVIEIPRDINKLCRTCMTVTEDQGDTLLTNHVIHNNQLTELSTMLYNVTSLKISPEDGLPEALCTRCVEQLKLANKFKNQCICVATNLKKMVTASDNSNNDEETKHTIKKDISLQLPSSNENYTKTEDKTESVKYSCQVCGETSESYYDLSKHMVIHNVNKTLLERFLESHDGDLERQMIDESENYNTSNEFLIKERKFENPLKTIQNISNGDFNSENFKKKIQDKIKNFIDCDTIEITPELVVKKVSKNADKKLPVGCKICSQDFKSRKELISHICTPLENQKDQTKFSKNKSLTTCSLCEKEFPDAATISLHFLKHAFTLENESNISVESQFFFCEMCGETFETDLLLHAHYIEKHEGNPIWPCDICSEVYQKEQDLIKHDQLLHGHKEEKIANDVQCVLCYQIFPTKTDLLVHSRAHLMKKYSCRKCSSSFCTQQSYFSHLKSHPGYQFTCSTCGKHLSTKSALKSHIVGVHSVELRHTCATCGKSFATPGRLKTHSLIHTSYKKYVCSYCGYSAHKVGDLQIHTRTHTSERPYKCTFAKCTMSFKTSSHLCDHVRRHLQIRKFRCNICSMGFTTNHGLKIHQMQHTGEKPHTCLVCHQKFRRKYHLKVHMKQHEPSV